MNGFDINTKEEFSPEVIVETLNMFGFVRMIDFVQEDGLGKLRETFEVGILAENYKYGYGKLARFNQLSTKLHAVKDFFDSSFFQSIIQSYWQGYINIAQEYSFVHDYKYDEKTVYGHLHFDRRHQLKFMLYLTDVNCVEYGAFSAIPKSNLVGRKLHEQLWKKALGLDLSMDIDIDKLVMDVPDDDARYKSIPLLLKEEDLALNQLDKLQLFPVTGKAGTLIIFDTHVLHLGGHVASNHERKVLRLHTFPVL